MNKRINICIAGGDSWSNRGDWENQLKQSYEYPFSTFKIFTLNNPPLGLWPI